MSNSIINLSDLLNLSIINKISIKAINKLKLIICISD